MAFAFLWALIVGFVAALWARSETRALERRVRELEEGLAAAHRRIDVLGGKLARLNAPVPAGPDASRPERPRDPAPTPAIHEALADAEGAAAAPPAPRLPPLPPSRLPRLPPTRADSAEEPGFSIVALLRRNPFATAGIGLLLLGFAYFFQSIEWGRLIPPPARIGLAWLASGVLGLVGARVSATRPLWGQLVQGGAAAVAYLATYVALAVFALVPPTVAFVLFGAISGLLVWRAVREDSKVLAAVGFLGAYAAPLLAMQGNAPLALTLSYGLLITSVALAIALLRGWLELAVYAHLCAAGLAAATWAGGHEPLSTPVQQLLVNAYGLQFVAFCVGWVRRREPDERASVVLGICLTIAVVVYLALQYWLLGTTAFTAVALATGVALLVLATRFGGTPFLRETAFVLGALAIASAFTQQDFGRSLTGFLLYAEGVLIVLSAGRDAYVRAWLGRGLVVLGALALVLEPSAWWWPLLPAAIGYALSLRPGGAAVDGVLNAAVAVIAVASLVVDRVAGLSLQAPLLYVASLVLAAGALLRGADRTARIVYGAAAAASALLFLVAPARAHLALHAFVLVASVAGAVFALWRVTRAAADCGRFQGACRAASAVVLLVPALLAWKAGAALPWLVGWVALALAAYAALEHRGLVGTAWRIPDDPDVSRLVPYAGAAGALLGLAVFLPLPSAPRIELLFGGVAFFVTMAAWTFVGPERTRGPRRVLGSTALAYGAALWLIALASTPAEAWRTALASGPLCVLLATGGVVNVFVSSRGGDRRGWQLAAAICVLATVLLLRLLGSALASPLGIAGSLLALGALFLVAGYLAPQPPARGEEGDAPAA